MHHLARPLFSGKSVASLIIGSLAFGFSLTADSINVNPNKSSFKLSQTDCQFSGTFEQVKRLDGIDQGLASNGVFYHHCDQGVIWSTTEPVLETLVMRRDGNGFVITSDDQKQLKSRQGKFLSSLLNSLMSGDKLAIEKQFELSTAANGTVTLTPKKRTLKRAVKFIYVNRSVDQKRVKITIVDRNFQKTHINSLQTRVFDATSNVENNCQTAVSATLEANKHGCELLLANNGHSNKQKIKTHG